MDTRDIYEATTRRFLAPLTSLLEDASVSEIMVVGHENVYCERQGKITRTEARFESERALLSAARNIAEYVNRPIDDDVHSLDGRLPDGSRVHVILPPASGSGVCLTIRRFQKSNFNIDTLVAKGSMSVEAADFLRICVRLHKSILISGGTGSGKTSLLNALSAAIGEQERIIVIEDTAELQLHQPHSIYLEAQPARPDGSGAVSMRDLFVDTLRMRPDRIIMGEVRRGEALDLIQSMISGHTGGLATVHANTPRDAAMRLETLCLMGDVALPIHVARVQTASALQIILQIARLDDGSRRVLSVSECRGLDETQTYRLVDLFRFEANGREADGRIRGELSWTGEFPTFCEEPHRLGWGSELGNAARVFRAPGIK